MATRLHRMRNLAVLPFCALICACSSSTFKDYIVDTPPTTATAAAPAARAARATAPASNAGVTRTPEATAGVSAPATPVSRVGCDRSKAISVGMTASDVYASCWGRPRNINTSVVGSTKVETLFYDGYNYIYMENGIVKSIETSGR